MAEKLRSTRPSRYIFIVYVTHTTLHLVETRGHVSVFSISEILRQGQN